MSVKARPLLLPYAQLRHHRLSLKAILSKLSVQADPAVIRITVTPALSYLVPGQTLQVSALLSGATNQTVSSTATIGSVAPGSDNTMTYTALTTLGTSTITAAIGQRKGNGNSCRRSLSSGDYSYVYDHHGTCRQRRTGNERPVVGGRIARSRT